MTFIVNHEGVVYQRDLGRNTEETAQAMTLFNPDSSWMKAEEKDTKPRDEAHPASGGEPPLIP